MKILRNLILPVIFLLSGCNNNLDINTSSVLSSSSVLSRSDINKDRDVAKLSLGERCNELKQSTSLVRLSIKTNYKEILSCKYNFDNGQRLILGQPASMTPLASCSSDEVLLSQNSRDISEVEERLTTLRQQRGSDSRSVEVVYTLPIVVHVIHMGEDLGTGNNISDLQIYTAVEELNNHFRKVTGSHGDGDGADTEIEFTLAVRDPDGNSTNGIMRVNASSITDYSEHGIANSNGHDGADEAVIKNLSKWDQDTYINVWVVNKINGNNTTQGFAYFPTSSTNDGIVVRNTAFGSVGTVVPYLDQSTTLTHEMGHYFALYHAFQNSLDCSETNCETQGDRVCDSPVTTINSSCSNPACEGNSTPQNVHLYMDYTGQSCKNEFSLGQKERMRDALESERPGLINSLGLQPAVTNDVATLGVLSPIGSVCDANQNANVMIANFGQNTINSFTFKIKKNGLIIFNQIITASIAAGSSLPIDVGSLTLSNGTHDYEFIASAPNGLLDENTDNNSITRSINRGVENINLNLMIELDYAGSENTWTLSNDQDEILQSGGPFQNNAPGTQISENICVPQGCYTFKMLDEYGDGQSFLSGSYELQNNESVIAQGSNDWGDESLTNFCLEPAQAPVCYTNEDVSIFLSSFGSSENLQYDSNNDGGLNAGDLLNLLSNFCGNN